MGRRLDLADLRMAGAIAAGGTLTAASRLLNVSQPALSLRLAQLETRLGVRLYDRSGRGMRPTRAGEQLLATARDVLGRLEEGESRLTEVIGGMTGRLRISTECHTTYRWLPRIVNELRRRSPHLAVEIVVEATGDPLAALADERLDVAIVTECVGLRRYRSWPLFDDQLYAVLPASDPLAGRDYLRPADLAGRPLVVYRGNDHPMLRLFLTPAGVEPGRLTQVPLTEAIVELVRAGQGIACLSGWACDALSETAGLARLRLGRRGVHRSWQAVTRNEPLAPYAQRFIQLLARTGPRPSLARAARRPHRTAQ